MKVDILNYKNEKAGTMEMPELMVATRWNPDLVHQALVTHLANKRDPWAHAKGRSEVRGGGKKPWKQKGTGRARHGSIRSPLWKGGGITHGPSKDRDFSKKINKKMKRIAIFSVFSKKFADNNIVVVDSFAKVGTKTKEWADALRKFVDLRSKTAVIFSTENKQLSLALGNIKNVDTLNPASINVYDLMKYKHVIIEQNAIAEIEQHYKIN